MKKQRESFVNYERSVDEHKLVASRSCSTRWHRGEQVEASGSNMFRRGSFLLHIYSPGEIKPPIISEKREYGRPSIDK